MVWLNSGNLFPEILEYMDKIRADIPNFVEINSDVVSSIRQNGFPVDVLPIDYTPLGQSCTRQKRIKLRAYLDCCYENIGLPVHQYLQANGYTLVFRGNRKQEDHRTPIENGAIVEGIQYVCPIEPWTSEEVVEYLRSQGEEMVPRLLIGHSSLDCMACTAYTNHSQERLGYIKQYHPIVFKQLKPVFVEIDKAIRAETEGLSKIISM